MAVYAVRGAGSDEAALVGVDHSLDAVAKAELLEDARGIGVQLGSALITLNEAIFVGTWFLIAFFLLAAGPLALSSGRRALGRSAIGTAVITLLLTATSVDNLGQMANFLWLIWVVWASISLARGERAPARAAAVARHA